MAKIKFGMMMTDARGKLGGQVFSKNRAGAYIRTKVTPVNPQTISQAAVRGNLATLSSGWNSLTAEQIAQWNNSVEDWQSTDIFGDIKKPTGKNLFVKLNINLLNNNLPTIDTPQAKIELPALNHVLAQIDNVANTLILGDLPVFASGKYQIEACPAVPIGVNYVKNKFRVINSVTIATTDDLDITTYYVNRFGALPTSGNVFFRIRAIGPNGQAGVPFIVKAQFD